MRMHALSEKKDLDWRGLKTLQDIKIEKLLKYINCDFVVWNQQQQY